MTLPFVRFALPRAAKATLIALAMVLVSGGLWQSRLLDGFAICAPSSTTAGSASAAAAPAATPAPMKEGAMASDMHAPTVFTLRSGVSEGRLVYFGVGGDINGVVNPSLLVHEGETVQINLINGEGAEHDIVVDQVRGAFEPGRRQGRQQRRNLHRVKDRRIRLLLLGARPS